MTKLLAAAVLAAALLGCGPSAPPSGVVIEKVYTPPVSGTGYGYGACTGSAGGTVVVGSCGGVIFYSEPERWTVILRGDDGHVRAFAVSPDDWAAAVIGRRFRQ